MSNKRLLITLLCFVGALRLFVFAAAIPFFLLYVYAIDMVTRPAKKKWLGPAAVGAIALFVAISQGVVNWPAFASQCNFFHMWQ